MENTETEKVIKEKKKKRPGRRKITMILLVIEILALCAASRLLSLNVSLNSDDEIQYAGTEYEDTISYLDGKLKVNNVTVSVPHTDKVLYNIAYSWGKDDTEYPTVPHSVTASYPGEEDKMLYDITLYRESMIPSKQIPKGKNAENWFADWETGSNEESESYTLDTKEVHGFMLSETGDDSEEGEGNTYETSTYYFTVRSKKDLSVYVLEGILYDKESLDEFRDVLNKSINSIKIKK